LIKYTIANTIAGLRRYIIRTKRIDYTVVINQ